MRVDIELSYIAYFKLSPLMEREIIDILGYFIEAYDNERIGDRCFDVADLIMLLVRPAGFPSARSLRSELRVEDRARSLCDSGIPH